jgi:hypothetical protein
VSRLVGRWLSDRAWDKVVDIHLAQVALVGPGVEAAEQQQVLEGPAQTTDLPLHEVDRSLGPVGQLVP